MGGALDSSRFRTYLSMALEKPANDISAMVIGGHGILRDPFTHVWHHIMVYLSQFYLRALQK
jgi:malate dehydrogenase